MVLKEYHGKVLPSSRDSFCYLFEVNVSSDRYKIYEKRKGVCEPINFNWSYYGKMSNIACQTVELGTVRPGGIFQWACRKVVAPRDGDCACVTELLTQSLG